jgi:patatin-like phospholipase/acyl hydrolase
MAPYRILTFDGGGILGLLSITLIERLEKERPGFLSMVDMFAGTSTGGIIALALASGMQPAEVRQMYENLGRQVFKDSILDNVRDGGQLLGAQYSNKTLKNFLTETFHEKTLGDLPKKVLISSFDLDNESTQPDVPRTWKAKFFHNFSGQDTDSSEKVVNVALYTSAAPTYFPIIDGYTDGGVVANNPSVCALAQAINPKYGKKNLRDIRLLSVSTGAQPKYIDIKNGDWGLAKWGFKLVNILLEGNVGLADYQCRQILGNHYLRINPILPVPIELDKVKEIPILQTVGWQYDLSQAVAWTKRYFKKTA